MIYLGNWRGLESARLGGPCSGCRAARVWCPSVVELIAGGVRPRWRRCCSHAALNGGLGSARLVGTRSRCGAGHVWCPSLLPVLCCLVSLTQGHASARLEGMRSRCGADHMWCPSALPILSPVAEPRSWMWFFCSIQSIFT